MNRSLIQIIAERQVNIMVQPVDEESAVQCAGIAAECQALANHKQLSVVLLDRGGNRHVFWPQRGLNG